MKRPLYLGLWTLLVFGAICLPALADELLVGPQGGYQSLTAAVSAAAPGDVIRIASGVYKEPYETYPILINKPLTLLGEPGAILKGPPFKALIRVQAPDVRIEGLAFELLRWGIVGTGDRLNVTDCRFTLSDNTYRVSSCGIWLAGVYDAVIQNNAFTGCGLCMAGPPLSQTSQGKVVLTGLFEAGDDTAYFTSHKVAGNTVNAKPLYYAVNQTNPAVPAGAGQVIIACCTDVTLDGLDVSDASIGAMIVHSDNVSLTHIKADRAGVFGVYLAFVNGGTLSGVVSAEANHGIDIRSARNLLIQNCTVAACEQGIFLSWVKDSLVADCEMTGGGRGLFMAAGAHNQIDSCTITGNENGICTEGEAAVLITHCTVSENSVAGIRLLRGDAACYQNKINGNLTGMIVADTTSVTVSGNLFSGNQICALYLRQIAGGKIVLNRFQGGTQEYISLYDGAADAMMRLNAFEP